MTFNPVLHSGPRLVIRLAEIKNGSYPMQKAWESLEKKEEATFRVLFQRRGTLEPMPGERYKRLEGEIWEFKANQHKLRIACFTHEGVTYLTNMWFKNEDDTPDREIRLAEAIRLEQLEVLARQKRSKPSSGGQSEKRGKRR